MLNIGSNLFKELVLEVFAMKVPKTKTNNSWVVMEDDLLDALAEKHKCERDGLPLIYRAVVAAVIKTMSTGRDSITALKELIDRVEGPVTQKIEQKTESFVAELPAKMEQDDWERTYSPSEKPADA